MNFVKLILSPYKGYHYKDASNIEMNILGNFLTDDVGCYNSLYLSWALDDKEKEDSKFYHTIGGNITLLEEEDGYIFLADRSGAESSPKKLRVTVQQFVQLLDDWRDKVCSSKPREVIIKYEDDQFIIETKDI